MRTLIGMMMVSMLLGTKVVAAADAAASTGDFEPRTYKDAAGKSLPYLLLRPAGYEPAGGKKHPLLVFLHGAGERGDDNRAQITHGKPFFLAAAKEHGCFVVAPQCPRNARWAEVDWSAKSHLMPEKPSEPMRLLMELLPTLAKEFTIDADRLYVMGLSMGGYGTWDAIQRYPGMFAAAVPICGGGDATGAATIAKTPVWAYHGDKDGAVPVSRSREMVEALRKAGAAPRYTELPNIGHNAWTFAFKDPQLPEWLFQQKRGR